jgi:hypothetical protein
MDEPPHAPIPPEYAERFTKRSANLRFGARPSKSFRSASARNRYLMSICEFVMQFRDPMPEYVKARVAGR